MENVYFTPGPSQLHPVVRASFESALAEDICSISHRSERFREIYRSTTGALRSLMEIPETSHVLFLSSATEAMERVIQSCVGEKSCHFVNGAFSKRFFEISQMLGRRAEKLDAVAGEGFDLVHAEVSHDSEMICVTQNETSTGIWVPPDAVTALGAKYPDKLLAVDVVSSAPCVRLNFSAADLVFFSVQKCFGMPSGLGVLVASARSVERARSLRTGGLHTESYHSLLSLVELGGKAQTYETPNVLSIYLLGKVAAWMHDYGVEKIRRETEKKAEYMYGEISRMAGAEVFVRDTVFRSPTVITAAVSRPVSEVRKSLSMRGLHVGAGYSDFKDRHIRIANFPAHSMGQVENLMAALEEVLG